MSILTQPEQPWYDDLDLGESPPLTPDELHDIAIRQSYSLAYWLDDDHEARTDALLAEAVELDYAQLEAWLDSRNSRDPFCVEEG